MSEIQLFQHRGQDPKVDEAGKCCSQLVKLFPVSIDKITDMLLYKGLYVIVRHEDSCDASCLLCSKTVKLEYQSKAKTLEQRSIKFANFLSHLYTNHPSELCETDWLSES